jgi:hypothetical protein
MIRKARVQKRRTSRAVPAVPGATFKPPSRRPRALPAKALAGQVDTACVASGMKALITRSNRPHTGLVRCTVLRTDGLGFEPTVRYERTHIFQACGWVIRFGNHDSQSRASRAICPGRYARMSGVVRIEFAYPSRAGAELEDLWRTYKNESVTPCPQKSSVRSASDATRQRKSCGRTWARSEHTQWSSWWPQFSERRSTLEAQQAHIENWFERHRADQASKSAGTMKQALERRRALADERVESTNGEQEAHS